MNNFDSRETEKAFEKVNNWSVEEGKLTRTFSFSSYKDAVAFMVKVAIEAETVQHHPMLTLDYSTVMVALITHDAGEKISEKDLNLAKRIDTFY
ncbi:4a-hydroxytetrahydrobiopterin dehydratase [Balneolaceae bacterium ANBcel3]|nr:4a-hydroxytetrahydrobiopterin dehydratase [Balneolaceae bacterium ANBcel3]